MKKIGLLCLWALGLLVTAPAFAQSNEPNDRFTEIKANLVFGTNQLLLGGFNLEGNLFYRRFVFDYSHGVSLNLNNALLDEVNQAYGLDVHIPWTTGFGVGYRLNDWLNLRAEPKWHRFELYHMGEAQTVANLIDTYTTFSLGIGAYANLQPFKRQENFLKGIMIVPSVRWWPRVSSSLENDQLSFYSRTQEQTVTHEALEVGIANTPLILNLSIGYSFGWDR
ncbi:MAG: hypothetical protein AAF804_09470 [Bacteroidota bacterium]